jgi:hypothetical protein
MSSTSIILNLIAVGMLIGCSILFRREFLLVSAANHATAVPKSSIWRSLSLWVQVKIISWFTGKAPPAIFEEYYARKPFIQAIVAFAGCGLVWMLFLINYLAHFLNERKLDEVSFIAISGFLLLVGNVFASQLRHYIMDYRSVKFLARGTSDSSFEQQGFSILSFDGEIAMPRNDKDPILSKDAVANLRSALRSPEESEKLLQELGLVDGNGETVDRYRSAAPTEQKK